MKTTSTLAWSVAGVVLVAGCYSTIGRHDPGPLRYPSGVEAPTFRKQLQHAYSDRVPIDQALPGFAAKVGHESRLHPIAGSALEPAVCEVLPLRFRFAWLTDVQLRQHEVKLFGKRISHVLDSGIETFEHDPVQEAYDWAVYLSHIAAINHLNANGPPVSFMIHTGDAIDAGTVQELYEFIAVSDRLEIPWFAAIGNHDVAIFGNYEDHLAYTREAGVAFYPIGNRANFIAMHGPRRTISGFGNDLLPVVTEGGHDPSVAGVECMSGPCVNIPPTEYHGFDLYAPVGGKHDPAFAPDRAPGYYAFDVDAGPEMRARVIVLDTARHESWGADGVMSATQRAWLAGQVATSLGRVLLIFAHHTVKDLDGALETALAGVTRGPAVVFTGHTHEHDAYTHRDRDGRPFYELNAGGLLVYPQRGRMIELRGSERAGCLVSRDLSNTYLPDEAELSPVPATCEKEYVANQSDLEAAARCGHSGAYSDYLHGRARLLGRPQAVSRAREVMNLVISLGPP
ncbi:metallophosphoesterase family protein [Haliangium sp.]|uniref:metallophosphoesterase family protein n=1 Tax=Haliangium sp. TaxID=2663208 RepID=UPI003D0D1B73